MGGWRRFCPFVSETAALCARFGDFSPWQRLLAHGYGSPAQPSLRQRWRWRRRRSFCPRLHSFVSETAALCVGSLCARRLDGLVGWVGWPPARGMLLCRAPSAASEYANARVPSSFDCPLSGGRAYVAVHCAATSAPVGSGCGGASPFSAYQAPVFCLIQAPDLWLQQT